MYHKNETKQKTKNKQKAPALSFSSNHELKTFKAKHQLLTFKSDPEVLSPH